MFVVSASNLRSAGARLDGDQTAENGIVSGSSRIGRKATFAVLSAAPSPTKSEIPCPIATIDSRVLRSTSKRWIVGVSHLQAACATPAPALRSAVAANTMAVFRTHIDRQGVRAGKSVS